jgi:hypothetical protein
MGVQIFQVQQLQRDPGAPQFGVDPRGIGQWARDAAWNLRPVEPLFQGIVAHPFERVPRQSDAGGTADYRRHGAGTDPQAARRLPVTPVQAPFQAQNLSNVSHGQSFRRHHPPRRTAFGQNGDGKTTPRVAPAPPSAGGEWNDHDAWNR